MLDIIAVLELNHVYIYIHNIYISLSPHICLHIRAQSIYIYIQMYTNIITSKFQPRSNLRLVMLVLQDQAVNRRDVGADTYPI